MINSVGSTFQSLQGLQASRSFQATGGKSSVFRQALENELQDVQPEAAVTQAQEIVVQPDRAELPQAGNPEERRVNAARLQPQPYVQLQPMIDEVRQIAENSGFVGVTSQDVMRAYHSGQSLLADYRV